MRDRELCIRCDDETGKAGRSDDSLYLAEYGPYCEECYPSYAADDLSDRIADLEQRIRTKDAENARLRALLDERTALLRECEDYVELASTEPCACTDGAVCLAHLMKPGADLNAKALETLSRIRAALETK